MEEENCEKGDSNPHGSPRWILSPVRLPVPPFSHTKRNRGCGLRHTPDSISVPPQGGEWWAQKESNLQPTD